MRKKIFINFASGNQWFEFQSFLGASLSPCLGSEINSPYTLSYDLQVVGLTHKDSKSIVSLWKSYWELGCLILDVQSEPICCWGVVSSALCRSTYIWNNFPRVCWRLVTERCKKIWMEFWKVLDEFTKSIRIWPW